MLIKMIAVYAIRAISGLSTLLAIFLIGGLYTDVELAEYALFMLVLNFLTVIVLWGDTVTIVEDYNKAEYQGQKGTVIRLGHKLLDCALVLTVSYFVLSYLGLWHTGLLAVMPIGVAGVFSALLVAQKKFATGMLCYEFSRAVVPLMTMIAIMLFNSVVGFNSLLACSYLSLFLMLPLLLIYSLRQGVWVVSLSVNVKNWLAEKRNALPIVMPQLIIVLVLQADRLIVEYWGSAAELAAYFAAQTLYSIVLIVTHATFNLMIPDVSKVAARGIGSLRNESLLMFKVQALLGGLLIPIAYVCFDLIDVDRSVSMRIFLLLIVGGFISSFFGVGLAVMQFCRDKTIYLKIVLAGLAAQYLFVFLLYANVGVYAASFGFLMYGLVTATLSAVYWHRRNVSIIPFFIARS